MLKLQTISFHPGPCELVLTLPFDARQRSRLRTRLDTGEEVALLLVRGHTLRGGDVLLTDDGRRVEVRAAAERVSTVRAESARSLLRAAYHLGNRHVPLEVGRDYLRYSHDHVLDGMVANLGLHVEIEDAPFEPEAGAYASTHEHGHGHEHGYVQRQTRDQTHSGMSKER